MKRRRYTPDDLFAPKCADCGRVLAETQSGYLCCPLGHGRLVENDTNGTPAADGGLFATTEDAAS